MCQSDPPGGREATRLSFSASKLFFVYRNATNSHTYLSVSTRHGKNWFLFTQTAIFLLVATINFCYTFDHPETSRRVTQIFDPLRNSPPPIQVQEGWLVELWRSRALRKITLHYLFTYTLGRYYMMLTYS